MSEPKPGPVRTSKCRCGPVLLPVEPERAMRWPATTRCPAFTLSAERWPYWLYLPSACRITTSYPYEPPQPAETTWPAAMALTVVPVDTAKSTPVW